MSKCNICGRNADTPYRVYDSHGKAIQGCIADFHTGHLIGESARWHNRPAAKKWRAQQKKYQKQLEKESREATKRVKKNPAAQNIEHKNPRGVLSKYRYTVQYSDNGKTWHDHGIFTHREIAEDIAQTLSRKYPTVYIRVAEK